MQYSDNERMIKLSIGGKSFITLYGTPKLSPLFNHLLSSDASQITYINNDEIFIDRNRDLFRYILQYMRSYEISIDDENVDLKALHIEAELYQLMDLFMSNDAILRSSPVNKKKDYILMDLDQLEAISSLSTFNGNTVVKKPLQESYELIVVCVQEI